MKKTFALALALAAAAGPALAFTPPKAKNAAERAYGLCLESVIDAKGYDWAVNHAGATSCDKRPMRLDHDSAVASAMLNLSRRCPSTDAVHARAARFLNAMSDLQRMATLSAALKLKACPALIARWEKGNGPD